MSDRGFESLDEPEEFSEKAPEQRPHALLWFSFLLFRPRTFFRHFAVNQAPLLTLLCAWAYGIASAIDRTETNAMRGREVPWLGNWPAYWLAMLVMGAIGGAFYFSLGGWWYRLRIKWAGDPQADAGTAKRVYLFSSQILAVPGILVAICEASYFETPLDSVHSDGSWWYMLLVILPFWTVVASYVGVRTMFDVRRGAALVWFAILPTLIYAIAIGGLSLLLLGSDPDLENPQTYDGSMLTCEYPGNWWVEIEEANPGGESILFEGMPDAFVRAMLYESEATPEEELAYTIEGYRESDDWEDGERFDNWAGHAGAGALGDFTNEGTAFSLLVFVWPLGDHVLEIQAIYERDERTLIDPVARLVGRTIRLR